jgi:hypothetical protein
MKKLSSVVIFDICRYYVSHGRTRTDLFIKIIAKWFC